MRLCSQWRGFLPAVIFLSFNCSQTHIFDVSSDVHSTSTLFCFLHFIEHPLAVFNQLFTCTSVNVIFTLETCCTELEILCSINFIESLCCVCSVFQSISCPTCGLNAMYCPGHLGHVELAVPVYHPLLFDLMYRLLKSKCFYCHHFRTSRFQVC
jgi:hypothetical protein